MITRRIGAEEFEGVWIGKGWDERGRLSGNRKAVCYVREGGKARVKGHLTNLRLKSEDDETGVGRCCYLSRRLLELKWQIRKVVSFLSKEGWL
jgi:hypothetical protein